MTNRERIWGGERELLISRCWAAFSKEKVVEWEHFWEHFASKCLHSDRFLWSQHLISSFSRQVAEVGTQVYFLPSRDALLVSGCFLCWWCDCGNQIFKVKASSSLWRTKFFFVFFSFFFPFQQVWTILLEMLCCVLHLNFIFQGNLSFVYTISQVWSFSASEIWI